MTPERWGEIQNLLHAALERLPSERTLFLKQACGEDAALRSEVVSLLSSAEEAGDFLETPAAPTVGGATTEQPERRHIGPYRVIHLLGSGGMGHVYLAVRADEQFEKRVAVKVVKRGTDTDFVLRRFRQERQILAGLEHPNIAHLLDGGTTDDGLPFFVMEYVDGEPITTFCDGRGLALEERLALFRTVCAAVHFAHQNLVVHRDLKPGNILVTAEGVPKLLDFGIAKLLNPELESAATAGTLAGFRLFTPEYASPEQIRGERITTASDVYSLGVLLYELLTGCRPYRVKSGTIDEIWRAVLEQEPEKPSTAVGRRRAGETPAVAPFRREPQKLRRALSGDLDTIVLKAMRKEPHRRYVSAEQLAEDIRRHSEELPVAARKDTARYRAGKFLRRHKAGAGAAALIVVSLIGGILATARQARVAQREHERAERRLRDVRQMANSFLFEFHNAIENLAGSTPARELLVRRALEYLGTLARESTGDRSLQRELAESYEKLGEIQGGSGANLGDIKGAVASFRAALQIREALTTGEPANVADSQALANCTETLAGILGRSGKTDESFRLAERALVLRKRLAETDPKNRDFRGGLARAHFFLSQQLDFLGRTRDQIAEMEKAREIYEGLAAEDPRDTNARRMVALTNKYLASAHSALGEKEIALEGYRRSEAIERELIAQDPSNALYKRDLSHSYGGIGESLFALGRIAEGAESYRKAIAIRQELADADPKNAAIRLALARGHMILGYQHAHHGDPRAALESLGNAIPIFEVLAASDPENANVFVSLANCHTAMGTAHERIAKDAPRGSEASAEKLQRAQKSYQKARSVFENLKRLGKLTPSAQKDLDEVENHLKRVTAALESRSGPAALRGSPPWADTCAARPQLPRRAARTIRRVLNAGVGQ